jgi:glycosyltransferase involved in cell wall biosynthesis
MAQTRHVLKTETLARRLQRVSETLGLPGVVTAPRVSVLLCTYRPELLEEALSHFNVQSYVPRELFLVLNGDGFDRERVERLVAQSPAPVRVYRTPAGWSKSQCLQLACEHARGELFVLMDDDDWYGPRYVEDFVLAFQFSEAGVVCKMCHVTRFDADGEMILCCPGLEFRYGEFGSGSAMGMRREVMQEVSWRMASTGEDSLFFRDCLGRGIPILSTSRFQFVYRRRDPKQHTWKMPRADMYRMQRARVFPAVARPEDFQP